ncbi:helix-turn-helix transcriptional regulator [Anaerobutyricum hallii]|nr:helix-turn-helix transcriptional regulator [Anaerobutyricum hallii]MCO7154331.1 helix-turn-helix transcriptional regulator [Anaerobutyricum hallii]
MTKAELSKNAGVPYDTLMSWEMERRIPRDVSLVAQVSRELGVSIEDLIDDEAEKDFCDTELDEIMTDKLSSLIEKIYENYELNGLLKLLDRFVYITGVSKSIKIMEEFINESSED